jgi:hypothetical protein
MWLRQSRLWFQNAQMWLRHSREWFIQARVEFQYDACDFNTNQLKFTYDYQKTPDWVLNSSYTTRMTVIFTIHTCDAGTLRVILAPWMWFWHSACDLNNHVCDLNTHACDFDTPRVKLLHLNIYKNLSYRHMPAAVWKTITHMRVESTHCAALCLYHTACWFNTHTWRFNLQACRFNMHACSKSIF